MPNNDAMELAAAQFLEEALGDLENHVDDLVTSFMQRERGRLTQSQCKAMLFIVYEAAWKRAERTLLNAKTSSDPVDAVKLISEADRYFVVFKNIGSYLLRIQDGGATLVGQH